jgi:hypothetical protein
MQNLIIWWITELWILKICLPAKGLLLKVIVLIVVSGAWTKLHVKAVLKETESNLKNQHCLNRPARRTNAAGTKGRNNMKYHAQTKGFIIDQDALEFVSLSVPYAIKHIRLLAGLPLDSYKSDGPLTDADYAMRAILEMADRLGIEMGARWGHELDVRKAS